MSDLARLIKALESCGFSNEEAKVKAEAVLSSYYSDKLKLNKIKLEQIGQSRKELNDSSGPHRLSYSVSDLINNGDTLYPTLMKIVHVTPTEPNSDYPPVQIVNSSPFCDITTLPPLRDQMSAFLTNANYEGRLTIDVSGLETAATALLADLLKALGVFATMTIQQQIMIDGNKKDDVYVVSAFGVVLLVVEMRRPSQTFSEAVHRACLGQCYYYSQMNRESCGLSYSFAVLLTIDECTIMWLNDDKHNALAVSSELPLEPFPLPDDHYNWTSMQVCASPVYTQKDNIPRKLASLLLKLINAQSYARCILRSNTIVQVSAKGKGCVGAAAVSPSAEDGVEREESAVHWLAKEVQNVAIAASGAQSNKKLAHAELGNASGNIVAAAKRDGERLQYQKLRSVEAAGYLFMANSQVNEHLTFVVRNVQQSLFHLLLQHNGRDGKTWIAANSAGELCAVKFRHDANKHGDRPVRGASSVTYEIDCLVVDKCRVQRTPQAEAAMAEGSAWVAAYNDVAQCGVKFLANRVAVVMPFAFCFDSHGCLSTDLRHHVPCDDSFHEKVKDWAATVEPQLVEVANGCRVKLLVSAVEQLAMKKMEHCDLEWRHLAILPVLKKGAAKKGIDLVPILVDLAEVQMHETRCGALRAMTEAACKLLADTETETFAALLAAATDRVQTADTADEAAAAERCVCTYQDYLPRLDVKK